MVRLELLGGASLQGPAGPVAGRSAQRRRLALLALLALSRRPLSRDRLVATLWPEAEAERARKLLSESLYVLRKELGEAAIVTSGDDVRLDPALVACDVVEFEDALDRGQPQTAAALYFGPFLDGFFLGEDADEFERWSAGERDRLEGRYRQALETLAGEAARRGDAQQAAAWWRRRAERDPYDGRTARALMLALVDAGDRAAALQHARVYETLVREELGAAPDSAIVALAEQIRTDQLRVAAQPSSPVGAGAAPAPSRADSAPPVQPGSPAAASAPAPPAALTSAAARAAPVASSSTRSGSPIEKSLREALAGEYEIVRLLGQGSSARVYLARDIALDMPVTIKVLHSEEASSVESRLRFEREARAAANIIHPNVSNVHRFGLLPSGEPFLVIEYVRGRTVEDRVEAEGPLSVAETRRVVADVASALEAAHRHGVIHRDIRPANILLEGGDGRAIVTDFGIAAVTEAWAHGHASRLTRTGQILGDPRYSSPEQARGEPVTESADVYSLALVAWHMLTGRTPRADATALEAALARLSGADIDIPPFVAEQDRTLADLLARSLAAEPEKRPAARTLAQRLRDPSEASREGDNDPWAWVPGPMRRRWDALARRRIPQWVGGVSGAVVLSIGLADALTEGRTAVYTVLATGVPAIAAAGVLAWFHGERGEQRFRPLEIAILLLLASAWLASLVILLAD